MKLITSITSSAALVALFTTTALTPQAQAHCEVPCGIYADDNVFNDLHTHLSTIEKAMNEINELSKDPGKNANQLIRWVNNKEIHATKIQEVVSQYFLTQRIKTDEANTDKNAYLLKLTQLHQMTVLAMKCKQTTDVAHAQELHKVMDAFRASYAKK
ncbi:MAG: superoxide dismutase [Ni] [Akkermansiaceae bacterium]